MKNSEQFLMAFAKLSSDEQEEESQSWSVEKLKNYPFIILRHALIWKLASQHYFWNDHVHNERIMVAALEQFTDDELLEFAKWHRELRDSR